MWPAYTGPALAAVVPQALFTLEIELPAKGEPGAEATAPAGADLAAVGEPTPRGIVLVLADGLGLENLAERAGHAPFISRSGPQEWRCGFPSTTVASLGSLGTGLPPGSTALAGYSLRDPSTHRLATLIKWDTPTAPQVWQPHRTLFERMDSAGRPATFIGEARFAGSALTAAALRGARFAPAPKSAKGRVDAAVACADGSDGLIYLYWGDLDKAGHAYGWQSAKWTEALEDLDLGLRQLVDRLPRGWEVWLTADHGMVDVTGATQWDVAKEPALAAGVDLVAGEARAVQLYTREPQAVADRWQTFLGEAAWVLTKAECARLELFGPLDSRVSDYVGDVVVAMADRYTVVDSRSQGPGVLEMVGHHGSLTSREMRIPLLRIPARW
jgi:hypothetical protein